MLSTRHPSYNIIRLEYSRNRGLNLKCVWCNILYIYCRVGINPNNGRRLHDGTKVHREVLHKNSRR